MTLPALASVRLPTGEFDEEAAIVWADALVSTTPFRLEREGGRRWLQDELQEGLWEGELDLALYATQLARDGDEICDLALRKVGAKLQTLLLQRRDLAPGHLQVIAYLQNVVLAPSRSRGRGWCDFLVRDVYICLCIETAHRELGVPATRNRWSKRAKRNPSAISLLMPALAKHHNIELSEKSIQENIWYSALANRLRKRGLISGFFKQGAPG
jgi:hypothetical protein